MDTRLLRAGSALLPVLLTLIACHDTVFDRGETPAVPPGGGVEELVEVRLTLDLPPAASPTGPRALTDAEENTLDRERCRLFIFSPTSDRLIYEAPLLSITPSAEDSRKGVLTALLRPTEQAVRAVFVGNLSSFGRSRQVPPGTDAEGLARLFPFVLRTDIAGWRLPMWGTSVVARIAPPEEGGVTAEEAIHLLRAVARVDVGLKMTRLDNGEETAQPLVETVEGKPVAFSLARVLLYNPSAQGLAAPFPACYDAAERRAAAPSLPAEVETAAQPIDYSDRIAHNLLVREVYLPETANGTALDVMKRPFLVVGLRYGETDRVDYYRIDFLEKDRKGTFHYLDLLRNNCYKLNILKVDGPGFSTPEEAAKSPAARLRYEVLPFEESEMDHIAYDGPYRLAVESDLYTAGRFGGRTTLRVETNWPKGWSAEVPEKVTPPGSTDEIDNPLHTDGGWLTYAKEGDDGLSLSVAPLSDLNPREGFLCIRAGRIRWLVHVVQTTDVRLDIRFCADTLGTPLYFIELSQLGLRAGLTTSKKTPRTIPGYRRFYVRTDPYVDPNDAAGTFVPSWSAQGTSDFLLWDFAKSDGESPSEAQLMGSVATDGRYPDGWTHPAGSVAKGRFFRYTGRDNLWECVITAPRMAALREPGDRDYYERRHDTLDALLSGSDDPSASSARSKLRVLQREYNVLPYSDEACRHGMLEPDNTTLCLLDGTEQRVYLEGNTACTVEVVSDWSDGGQHLLTALPGALTFESDQLVAPYRFTLKDDLTAPKLYHGYVTISIASPNELFDSYTITVETASAVKQPESNCYILRYDSPVGILIPVSRVNTAADYYNSLVDHDKDLAVEFIGKTQDIYLHRLEEDDPYEPWLVWSDIGKPVKDKKTGKYDYSDAGIRLLRPVRVGVDAERYLYVVPSGKGDNDEGGSALVGIRSGKISGRPNLWSWHLWLVKEYPEMFLSDNAEMLRGAKYAGQVPKLWVLDRNLGAITRGDDDDYSEDQKTFGYAYQWGRKDPFPFYKQEMTGGKMFFSELDPKFTFDKYQRGSRTELGLHDIEEALGEVATMRETVEKPYMVVAHQTTWLAEHLPYNPFKNNDLMRRATWRWLWEKPMGYSGRGFNSDVAPDQGTKSPFDPSPVGMRLPMLPELDHLSILCKKGYKLYQRPFNFLAGTIYDGAYVGNADVRIRNNATKDHAYIAGASFRDGGKQYSGRYFRIINKNGEPADVDEDMFRRAMGFAVRPVADVPVGLWSGIDKQWIADYITKYWPLYERQKP